MCLTLDRSRMSKTIVYGAEVLHEGVLKHVMGYQNTAENLSPGPNAMLLPIPSAVPLGPTAALDMTPAKGILKEYADYFQPRARRGLKSMGFGADTRDSIHVFTSGSYTVVLAQDAAAIPSALSYVPADRRPAVKQAIFDAYARLYPGWSVALACYDGTIEAEPIAFVYEPLDPSSIFLPGLDGHDGEPPRLGTDVKRDHTLVWASSAMKNGYKAAHKDPLPPNLAPFFPGIIGGTLLTGRAANGDFRVDIATMATAKSWEEAPVRLHVPS